MSEETESGSSRRYADNPLGMVGMITSALGAVTFGILSPFGFILCLVALSKKPRMPACIGLGLSLLGIPSCGVGVALVVPQMLAVKAKPMIEECQSQQWIIEGSLETYMYQNEIDDYQKALDAIGGTENWNVALKDYTYASPHCPKGGTYSLLPEEGPNGEHVQCSIPEHVNAMANYNDIEW